jgi:hypothetical protein
MGNGVILIPPHKFEHHIVISNCRELKTALFGLASNGITSITNFMKICVFVLKLLHAYRQTLS